MKWYYRDGKGKILATNSLEEIVRKVKSEEYDSRGYVWQDGQDEERIPYSALTKYEIVFEPAIDEFTKEREEKRVTVITGPNNGGKTLLLKNLYREYAKESYFLACNRFYHISKLRSMYEESERRYHQNFVQQFEREDHNSENNAINLEQIIISLKDVKRRELFQICGEMLGNTFTIERVDEENEMSAKYIKMDKQNLAFGSTGTRLLMTIMGLLLDESFETILIDEPVGLSPRIQSEMARYVFDDVKRERHMGHLKHIYWATHSHLLLDRKNIRNNYYVEKEGGRVSVRRVETLADINRIHFEMLGNKLEDLFLPSVIIVVEGKTDREYLAKVMENRMPEKGVALVDGKGDGGILSKVRTIIESLGELQKSPYQKRIVALLDSRNSLSKRRLVEKGLPEEHIIVWKKNGIEYYYPKRIMKEIFLCGDEEIEKMELTNGEVIINRMRKTKTELSEMVVRKYENEEELDDELERFLLGIEGITNQ